MNRDEDTVDRTAADGVRKVRKRRSDEGGRMLGTLVVEAVAESAGVTPPELDTSLYDVIDPDALDALFASRRNGVERTDGQVTFSIHGHYATVSADGVVEVESELARIKRTGGNLLLTGQVPDEVLEDATVRLLGRAGDHERVVALHDRNVGTAYDRLDRAGASAAGGYVLDYQAEARSTTAATASGTDYRVTDVGGDLADFGAAIEETLRRIDFERRGLAPGELRFCFDSLRPVVDDDDDRDVEPFLSDCFDAVEDLSGLGCYVLPMARRSEVVADIEPLFDATVELRVGEAGPEQRWYLQDTEFTTDWFALDER
ncbi:DUF7504 family protein [Halomicrococcus sp. NG-SE-24]|uniref:DUF7504 family protein n=1 Tax=Halomicrococcus sp. NG-SE-24 TaxID=3436928 RepID=UPI003D962F5E